MEWLRWIVLLVGLLVIGGIVWMYRRHRSEQAVDLGGDRPHRGDYHDPIDASVGARVKAEGGGESDERREPQLELGGGWSQPDTDGFIDGASAGRVVRHAPDADDAPDRPTPGGVREEPALEPEPAPSREPSVAEEVPERDDPPGRPQPGFSRLFTRQGQADASPDADDQPVATEPPSADEAAESADAPPADGGGPTPGAVISMMIVDREQAPMRPERVRQAIEESGFEFGEFSIYHFQDLDGADWFSLMNAVSPGQFDPDDLSSFETPALALFMQLPVRGGADPSLVFERMHQVATSLAESLDAMLIDDRREPLDSESIDRYRELIDNHG